jgi:acyl-coenzyme A thioesterase PaaI-like protein
MSEAAPGFPDREQFATPERSRLAEAVRRAIDVVMTVEDVSVERITAAAESFEAATAALAGPTHLQSRFEHASGLRRTSPNRNHGDYLPRSPIVGESSPLAPPIAWEWVPPRIVGRVTFGAAYEGPPSYVHGGIIALAFDEMLGMANIASGHPGMTGTLTVRYRRPTPLYHEVAFEAWVVKVEGRRIATRGTLSFDDVLCAECDGLFVQPRPELAAQYFGPPRT